MERDVKLERKRFIDLEKDYTSYNDQLCAVPSIIPDGDILRKDYVWRLKSWCSTDNTYFPTHDLALNWVITKIKNSRSEDEGAKTVRASPQTWVLLTNLVALLPSSKTAKSLQTAGIISLVAQTLSENFTCSTIQPLTSFYPFVPQAHKALKRKRTKQDDSPNKRRKAANRVSRNENVQDRSSLEIGFSRELFEAIWLFLYVVTTIADGKTDVVDVEAPPYMSIVLRLDCADAAVVLDVWMTALSSAYECRAVRNTDSPSGTMSPYTFDAISRIWSRRTFSSGDKPREYAAICFSDRCFKSATVLWQTLKYASLYTNLPDLCIQAAKCLNTVEQLIGKHVIMPAKDAFATIAKDDDQNPDPVEVSNVHKTSLVDLIQPTANDVPAASHGFPEKIDNSQSSGIDFDPVMLFDIAVRCTNLGVLRQRIAESPWLEHVFIALARKAGLECTEQEPIPQQPQGLVLDLLLERAVESGLKFRRNILLTIVKRYSGLGDNSSNMATTTKSKISWKTVASMLRLDPTIFDTRIRQSNANETEGRQERFGEALIGSLGHITEKHDATGRLPGGQWVEYAFIRDQVMTPFVKSRYAVRDLQDFLQLWSKYLEKSKQTRERTMLEDPSLSQSLSAVLETSLTVSQITELAKKFATKIESKKARSSKAEEGSAAADMLRIIVEACHNDETTAKLEEFIERALKASLEHFSKSHRLDECIKSSLRMLIVTTFRKLNVRSDQQVHLSNALLAMQSTELLKITPQSEGSADSKETVRDHQDITKIFFCVLRLIHDFNVKGFPVSLDTTASVKRATRAVANLFDSSFDHKRSDLSAIGRLDLPTLVELPGVLSSESIWTDVTRQQGLESMISFMVSGIEFDHASEDRRAQIEQCLRFSDTISNTNSGLWKDYLRALSNFYSQNIQNEQPKLGTDIIELILLRIQPILIARKDRERINDRLIELIKKCQSTSDIVRRLSLACRLMGEPFGHAKVAKEDGVFPELIWNIDSIWPTLDSHQNDQQYPIRNRPSIQIDDDEDTLVIWQLCRKLTKLLLQNRIETSKHVRLDLHNLHVDDTICPALLAAYAEWFAVANTVDEQAKAESLEIQKRICTRICGFLDSTVGTEAEEEPNERINPLNAHTHMMLEVLLSIDKSILQQHTSSLSAYLERAYAAPSHPNDNTQQHSSAILLRLHTRIASLADSPASSLTPTLLIRSTSTLELMRASRAAAAHLSALPPDSCAQFFHALLSTALQSADPSSTAPSNTRSVFTKSALALHATAQTLLSSSPRPLPAATIPPLIDKLCTLLPRSPNARAFAALAASLDLLLQTHARAASQYSVERTLSIIVICTSASGPPIAPTAKAARAVFTHLNRLLHTLLLLHRRSLRGRFDQLLLALQALQRCFFYLSPSTSTATGSTAFVPDLPLAAPWLPRSAAAPALTAEHAAAFNRVIAQLTSPSVSSVTPSSARHAQQHPSQPENAHSGSHSRRSGALTDATAAARAYAAQYIPMLVLSFLHLTLRSRVRGTEDSSPSYLDANDENPEKRRERVRARAAVVRAELLKGVWDVFDLLGREGVQKVVRKLSLTAKPGRERDGLEDDGGSWRGVGDGEAEAGMRSILHGLVGEWRRR